MSESNFEEFVTFETTTKDGTTIEMAVLEEFEFERKNYAACGKIVNDEIDMEGVYIFRIKTTADDFVAEKIVDMDEYNKVTKAYLELED